MSTFWGDGSPVVSAPAVISGSVGLSSSFGVIAGTGLSPAARTANGTALQSVINYAISNNKYVEADAGTYEFDLAGGLVVDASGFVWRGSRNVRLTQFAANTPVITLGKAVANGDGPYAMDIQGLTALYGSSQTGNTGANALVMASSWRSRFSQLSAGNASGAYAPYRSIYFNGSGSDKWWFSNEMSDCGFGHAQNEIWRHSLMSTGNVYNNIYIGGGNPTITAYTSQPVIFSNSGGRGQGSVFNQFNIEWCSGNRIIYFDNCRQFVFNSIHIEGCQLTGSYPSVFYLNTSELSGCGWDLENCKILSASATDVPAVFGGFGASKVDVSGMRLGWLTVAQADTNVNMTYRMSWNENNNTGSRVYLRNMYIEGGGSYGANALINAGDAPFPSGGDFVYNGSEQFFSDPYYAIDADFTVYGCYRNPTIRYPASLGADRTLVLSDRKGSSGWQNTAKIPTGSFVMVVRASGTAAHTLTVKNLTSGGTTLVTGTTSDVRYLFQFDGTNWAQVR